MVERPCVKCGKIIKYSIFAFEPNADHQDVTASGLCSNGIDGCWEERENDN